MRNKEVETASASLDRQSEELVKKYVRDFTAALIANAKLETHNTGEKTVTIKHIEKALELIISRKRNNTSQFILMIGSALFGAFVQGFISEVMNGNITLIVVYVILGFIGTFLSIWSFRK